MRIKTLVVLTLSVALATANANAQKQLRADAGVVAGNAAIGPQLQCATSGPTIGAPWYAGISIPTEGIAACGLSGMIDDKTAAAGPISATAAASGPMAGSGTFTGTANARANYWNLGVSASATATGGSSGTTYRQAASYASFVDYVTFTSPTHANGTAGTTNFKFFIEGLMNSLPNAPYGQQGDVQFSLFINNILWTAFAGTVSDNQLPYLRGGSTGIPGKFVSSPGAFIGSDSIETNANFQMIYGTPLRVEVALYTTVSPCCFGASMASDFYNSALLTGIDVYDAGGVKTNDFLAVGTSGIRVNAQGIIVDPVPPTTTTPEPATVALTLFGLVSLAAIARRNRSARTAIA